MARHVVQSTPDSSAKGRAATSATHDETVTELAASIADIPEKRRKAILFRAKQMPKSFIRRYGRAVRGKNLRSAVGAHCYECVQWCRSEVGLCTSLGCSLWPYRPEQ